MSKKQVATWTSAAAIIIITSMITAAAVTFSKNNGSAESNCVNQVSGGNGTGVCINNGTGQQNCNALPTEENPPSVDRDPKDHGPWAFAVKDTVVNGTDIGLAVRMCDKQDCGCGGGYCARIGIALDRAKLYAMCQEGSGFNGGDTSTVWLQIKWPSNTSGSTQVFSSSPNDPYTGWVSASLVEPACLEYVRLADVDYACSEPAFPAVRCWRVLD